jgi:ribonuclease T2
MSVHHLLSIAALLAVSAAPVFAQPIQQSRPAATDVQDRRQNAPGQFDYYVLSLSWSPSFCETAGGNGSRQQCGPRPYSFVVHGLWPQYERGFPQSCQSPPPRLERNIVSSMLDLMPAPGLIYHEWDQHGTCSGLEPREYFDVVRKARAKVRIPAQYDNPKAPLSVSPNQIINAFVGVNEGLKPTGIIIDCDRTRLREVRICLSRDMTFRDCSPGPQRACRTENLVMPPVRGGSFFDPTRQDDYRAPLSR